MAFQGKGTLLATRPGITSPPLVGYRIGLAVVSLIFSIFIAEVGLKLFYPQIMEHDQMFEADPHLGWRFIPNRTGSIVFPGEANLYIRTNSLGFRDNALPSANEKPRKLLVLGDSFVSNIAVPDNDVFTEVMERQLRNTAVLNFGVNGYGQVQSYLTLREWFERVNPDLMILMITVRNDFEDNIGSSWLYPRPYASWNGGTLHIHPPAPVQPRKASETFWKVYRRSHFFQLLDRELNPLIVKFSKASKATNDHEPSFYTPPEFYLCRSEPSEKTQLMYRTMEELLLRIAGYARERGVPLVFAIGPSMLQVDDQLWSSTLQRFGERPEHYVRSLPNDRLMQFAAKNDLLMMDLLPILESETKKGRVLYFPRDDHWNSEGNHVVAHALLEYLRSKSLIQ
jgi:hypothetical protein